MEPVFAVPPLLHSTLIPSIGQLHADHLPVTMDYTLYPTGRIAIHDQITNTSSDPELCSQWYIGTIGLGDPQHWDGYWFPHAERQGTALDNSTVRDSIR